MFRGDFRMIKTKDKRKMKRQGLLLSIRELRALADELEKEQKEVQEEIGISETMDYNLDQLFQINITNKIGSSDTWEIEK